VCRQDTDALFSRRSTLIDNGNLCNLGRNIAAKDLNFLAPNVALIGDELKKRVANNQSVKKIADAVEAMIGASLLSCDMAGAMKFIKWIGLETIPVGLEIHVNPENGFPLLANRTPLIAKDELDYLKLCFGLQKLEAKINYTFKDKTLLIEALTHPTCYSDRLTVNYQRLAFLGDAVLGNSFCADSLLDPSINIAYSFQIT
jgi:dsRNA-specific ribonuclease